jgi:hypothetical protein
MLWYKGWLETRVKLAIALGLLIFFLVFLTTHPIHDAKMQVAGLANFGSLSVVWTVILLAGAGIATQPAFQATKGLHGSMLYTLSMPVSRLRLLTTRAAIGWLESAAAIAFLCGGMWLIFPQLRTLATPVEMFEYTGTLIACASTIYFLSVLLATFLDEQWRIWGSMIATFAFGWASSHYTPPPSIDILRAVRDGSPLLTHAIPWSPIAFALGLAAILFFAALKIVQTREY